MGTALGIGAVSIMSMPPAERVKELSARLKAEPNKADLDTWLKAQPEPKVEQEALDLLWMRVEASGWDAVHSNAREHSTKMKGRWEQVTRDNWGHRKASMWLHPMLVAGRRYNLEEATAEAARLDQRATAMSLKRVAAISNKGELEQAAAGIPDLEAEIARLLAQSDGFDRESDALIAERAALPDATDASQFPECPHCRRAIQVLRGGPDAPLTLAKAPPALSGQALEDLRAKRSVVSEKIERLGVDIQRNAVALADAREKLTAAQKAQADLERLRSFSDVSQGEIDAAIEEAREANRKRDAIQATVEATAIYAEWAVSERATLLAGLRAEQHRLWLQGAGDAVHSRWRVCWQAHACWRLNARNHASISVCAPAMWTNKLLLWMTPWRASRNTLPKVALSPSPCAATPRRSCRSW